MYSNAELFIMASNPRAVKEIFLNNVTLSAEDGASGCIDLDAEKERLSIIWDLAHLPMRDLISHCPSRLSVLGFNSTAYRFCKMRGHPAAHGAELVCRKPGLPGIRPLFVG